MKVAVYFLIFFVAVISARPDKGTNKFENVDVDKILGSDRLLTNYFKCLMDRGKCTSDGAELKAKLSDALQSECSECSESERKTGEKVLRFLYKNKPDMWIELTAKYDPQGTYVSKIKDKLESDA